MRFTRRTATVTMSAPEAACARAISGKAAILAGADNQAGMECAAGDNQLVCHWCPQEDS